jgi:hypothetical protein
MTYPICFNRFIIVATQGPPSDPRQVADSSHQGRKKYRLKLLQAHFSPGEMRGLSPPSRRTNRSRSSNRSSRFKPSDPKPVSQEEKRSSSSSRSTAEPELLSKGSVQTG